MLFVKKKKKFYKVLSYLLFLISLFLIVTIIYLNLLPLKYLVILVSLFSIIILFLIYKLNHKSIVIVKFFVSLLSIILVILELMVIVYIFFSLDFMNNIFDNNVVYYGVYVRDGKYKSLTGLNNKSIIVYDNDYMDGAVDILKEKIDFKKIDGKSIDDSIKLVIDGKEDALFINEELINNNDLKKLTRIKVNKKDDYFKELNVRRDSFTVYISGVDGNGRITNSARSDVNILAVVNPRSGRILIVNTPRDYYVLLGGKNKKDKLTHAGLYGIEESAKTLGLLYDIDVNYYVRVNFTSFVKLIDALGGVNVNVEKPDYRYNQGIDCGNYVCEQNSHREFGEELIKFKYGMQKLNGEQALAYARNRYQYAGGDNDRQLHQQEVLKATIDKVMSKDLITNYSKILSSLSSGIKTNISKDDITKYINKQIDNEISIETLVAKGKDSYGECYSTGSSKAYVMMPDDNSVNDIKLKITEVMN